MDNPEFIKFCEMMRPGVQLARRLDISGKYLDAVHNEEMEKAKAELKGNYLKTLA